MRKNELNKKEKIVRVFLFTFYFFVLINAVGCKTAGRFSGTAALTVIVVDENGRAADKCKLVLSNFNRSKNGITNSSGVCVFNDIPSGEYKISIQKNGFAASEDSEILFTDVNDIFCFRIYSAEYLFDMVCQLYDFENYEDGLKLLDSVCYEKNSLLESAICFYKAYGYALCGEEKKARQELKSMKSSSKKMTEKYSSVLEIKLEEVKKHAGKN